MSYNVTVKIVDGDPDVVVSGPVPDGKWVVAGHDDGQCRSLSVAVYGLDGKVKSVASNSNYKEV